MAVRGIRGTDSWVANRRPENWREAIIDLMPASDVPFGHIIAKMKGTKVDDPHYHWWMEEEPRYGGPLAYTAPSTTAVFTDSAMLTAYAAGAVNGSILYLKTDATTASFFVPGETAILQCAGDTDSSEANPNYAVHCIVVSATVNGSSSCIGVKILWNTSIYGSSDTAVISGKGRLFYATTIIGTGTAISDGSEYPEAIMRDPVEYYNYCQIFADKVSVTKTADMTKLRTGEREKNLMVEKKRKYRDHIRRLERGFLFNTRTSTTGANGQPLRTTGGLITTIRELNPTCVNAYHLNSTYSAKTWTATDGGTIWLDNALEPIFGWGSSTKLGFCGSGVLMALEQLAKEQGMLNLEPGESKWGLKIRKWITTLGDIDLVRHPLFCIEPSLSRTLLIFEPDTIEYMYMRDTEYMDTTQTDQDSVSGVWLTQAGLRYKTLKGWGLLSGFGLTNVV